LLDELSLDEVGVGYSHVARSVWLAIMHTWLAWFMARWAFINTRSEEMALERERVAERLSQAMGFVSRIIVRMEGGVAVEHLRVSLKL
jgi:hypothetical protein